MSVTTTLAACSTTVSLNGPDGAVDAPSTLDDSIRYALSFVATLRDTKASIGSNADITALTGLTTALSVGQGGTGLKTLTGLAYGNGGSAFTAATAGQVIGVIGYTPASLVSPAFTGNPTAPTPAKLDNSTSLATTVSANFSGSVVGSMRNGRMSVTAASATATFTADEIVVETALGGAPGRLANFSATINLAATGAGGMDTGVAPVSGFVAIYAIYNPSTLTSALLAKNATAALQTEIYSGANMPAGFTASALVSVWPTNGSSQLKVGYQTDRLLQTLQTTVANAFASVGAAGSLVSLGIASAVPINAKTTGGQFQAGNGGATPGIVTFGSGIDAAGTGFQIISGYVTSTTGVAGNFTNSLSTAQTLYYYINDTISSTYTIYVSSYTF